MKFDYTPQLSGIWIMYLRKSRQDNPEETVEEVLAKHETMLQEYAEREISYRIPEENIYREVVSGESIDERVEIKKVLARLEDPNVAGVLVMEPSRLSRGDLSDCAKIIDTFRFSHSMIATPMMTYDLENKMERKFFQDELLRGNDYLEYTKEILFRGRVAAAKRGCFVSGIPPAGFNRIKIGKDWTLKENDYADNIRLVFSMRLKEGKTDGAITRSLNAMGIPSPSGGKWTKSTVHSILSNPHYAGFIRYNAVRTTIVVENGERKKRHLQQPESEIILVKGKHKGFISVEDFMAAQRNPKNTPRVKDRNALSNKYAGVLRCSKCGRALTFLPRSSHGNPQYKCPGSPKCFKSAQGRQLEPLILDTLENAELPKLRQRLKNGDGDAAVIQKRRLEKLSKQMAEYQDQEEAQYELLEKRTYTQAIFDRRNAALRKKMEDCEAEIAKTRAAMPQNVDYQAAIVRLEDAIAALKDPTMPVKEQNKILRSIVKTINYSAVDHGRNKTAITLDVLLRL